MWTSAGVFGNECCGFGLQPCDPTPANFAYAMLGGGGTLAAYSTNAASANAIYESSRGVETLDDGDPTNGVIPSR